MPLSPAPSTIQLLVDGEDITEHVVFAQSRFDLVGTATPGTARIVCRDTERVLHFTTGHEVQLIVDDVTLWGGLLMEIGRSHFFPVVDTTDVTTVRARQWILSCSDYNIWFDKRFLRDVNAYTTFPTYVPEGTLGDAVRYVAQNYIDLPPGLSLAGVDDTNLTVIRHPIVGQGKPWRAQMEDYAERGGFAWYIDASKVLQFRPLRDVLSPFAFVDRNPNGVTSIGFREGTIREDGLQMVTDALVWGGSSVAENFAEDPTEAIGVIFARYPDPPAANEIVSQVDGEPVILREDVEAQAIARQNTYGRWQRAEVGTGQDRYGSMPQIKIRAYAIVAGEPGTNPITGIDYGLGRPVWGVQLTWFAHDVPNKAHLHPDDLVNMVFYSMGESLANPLPLLLPLRSVSISFPTLPPELDAEPLTYVRFDGEFGISYSDSRYLWRFLQKRSLPSSPLFAEVSNSSTSTIAGARGNFFPLEGPNGTRTDFTLPFGYLAGSTEVFINGLHQRVRYEYVELDPGAGTIRFLVAPHEDDTIWVICRTAST